MFEVTPDEIAQLNDVDLRELVARLCEAEVASRGLSPAHVTWGGNQTAADGGLDVRVALPLGTIIDGFVPRCSTGFQVKTPDMARAAILTEMRPTGVIRPVIQELADGAGAYVVVSSHGSTADVALINRRNALREAVADVANADQLHTDFYDRTRLATWVRRHAGLITWVKEKIGRSMVGWRPYGPWSGAAEGVEAEYLIDEKLRLHLGTNRDTLGQPVAEAIDNLRDELARPGKIVRLVGLSGVGKTRLVQALFDTRIGLRPLPPSLAVYTNLSDDPDPQPMGLASDLIANRTRSVLIIDNCPPDLHRRLSDLCGTSESTLSVLTVEYDVRDDQPEGTQVVTLGTSSPELIEKLVQRRYPHLSQVDARTIAEASGGNARIAIALAGTVEHSETVAGLSDDDLFQRLFRQRHDRDDALLQAAQACSLVYSFQGEALAGDDAELPRLALLADQRPQEVYRHVGELLRRDLVQQRSVWRAVLPHAIANRLAARALEDIPYDLIDQQLVTGGTDRLARSFSRRLAFLHEHPRAIGIVARWLAPGGFLGDVAALNDLGQAMFENVAPVLPTASLSALERISNYSTDVASITWQRHRSLLRSLAFDPSLFSRSAALLARAATESKEEREAKDLSNTFISLFPIMLSGTHATINQRIQIIEDLLHSKDSKKITLGLAALSEILKTTHFSSGFSFEFGARSRDYGFRPRANEEVSQWYGAAIFLIERLTLIEGLHQSTLRNLLAQKFRGLWSRAHMFDELDRLFRLFAADGFWREGWIACRETMRFDKDQLSSTAFARLAALESELKPSILTARVRAVVMGDGWDDPDLDEIEIDGDFTRQYDRLQAIACELGTTVAVDEVAFADLLPDLVQGGHRTWPFGRGLAEASADPRTVWARLVLSLDKIALDQRNAQVLMGFLEGLAERDQELAHDILDAAFDQPSLITFIPVLQTAVQIDRRGVERLKRALKTDEIPAWSYRSLAAGRVADQLAARDLKELLLIIANKSGGFEVAVHILYMNLLSDRRGRGRHEPIILEAGRGLLRRVEFRTNSQSLSHQLAEIAKYCLTGAETASLAAEVAGRLRRAVAENKTYAFDNDDLLKVLLRNQSVAVLRALFEGSTSEQQHGVSVFDHLHEHRSNPADEISCENLIAWCNEGGEKHYLLAASVISFASRSEGDGRQFWSKQADALFGCASNPLGVLDVFIQRFRPKSWSGSRAAVIEANAFLLDSVSTKFQLEGLTVFVAEAKERLSIEISAERKRETSRDRVRDEQFE